jgi:leader peptidase (prepilin peptidase)/N-methyltransferase
MEIFIVPMLFLLGAIFGSFAMCQVWRTRVRQKEEVDHKADEIVKRLRAQTQGKRGFAKLQADRSICLHCGYQLTWYDNIPIVSWLLLRGKCRKCHKNIGMAEILCELGLAAVFALSYPLWPFALVDARSVAVLIVFLALLVGLTILFVFDLKWKRLPEKVLIYCIVCAAVFAVLSLCGNFSFNGLLELIGALALLPGLYWVIYRASGERLVGGGDWLLAIPLALVAGNYWVAFFVLFVSNLLGSLISLPIVLSHKRRSLAAQVAFGPFLIAGFLIVFFAQNWLVELFAIASMRGL